MKDFTMYLISVGLAFYGGMKIPKKPIVKTVIKKVVSYDKECNKALISTRIELNSCIKQHDDLVKEANQKVKDLETDVDSCHDKYYYNIPHTNLSPEKVKEKQPKMEGIYEDY